MTFDHDFQSSSMTITHIKGMVMDASEFITYQIDRFPFEVNGLVSVETLYPSLVLTIDHMRMPLKTTKSRCQVLNALVAYWPGKAMTPAAIVEFRSIQKALETDTDIRQCKRILLNILASEWGVTFKGKELIVS